MDLRNKKCGDRMTEISCDRMTYFLNNESHYDIRGHRRDWWYETPAKMVEYIIEWETPCVASVWNILWRALWESIPRLLNEGTTTMTARCAPACSQALPVKLGRWRSSGPSSLMLVWMKCINKALYLDRLYRSSWLWHPMRIIWTP